jgi:NADH-quinone oxidoreductase subunit M
MPEFTFPILTLAIAAPAAAALAARWLRGRRLEWVAITAAAFSVLLSSVAARQVLTAAHAPVADPTNWFVADPFTIVPMVLFSILTLLTLLIAPARDRTPAAIASTLVIGAGTLATYAAGNLAILLVALALSVAPLWFCPPAYDEPDRAGWLPRTATALSLLLTAIAVVMIALDRGPAGLSASSLGAGGHGAMTAPFALLMAAALLRGAILPFHQWVIQAVERGPMLPVLLLVNGHVGIFLVLKLAAPLAPELARSVFPLFGILALATAMYVSFGSLAETSHRRVIARMLVSQSAIMQAALTSDTPEGVTGALLHWSVVCVASTGLFFVCRALEARVGAIPSDGRLLGFASGFPRFAVFFAAFGLAIAGLPGTLGFCSEDLLLHGALSSDPLIGLALPVATALNAFQIFRLFSRLFLGKPTLDPSGVSDARLRERWVLVALLVFLVGGGLWPEILVTLHAPAAETLVRTLSGH